MGQERHGNLEREPSHDSFVPRVAKTLERVDSGHGHYDVYYAASSPGLLVTAFKHGSGRVEVEGAPRLVACLPPSPLYAPPFSPATHFRLFNPRGRWKGGLA